MKAIDVILLVVLMIFINGCGLKIGESEIFFGGKAELSLKLPDNTEVSYERYGNQEVGTIAWDDGSVLMEKQKADNTEAIKALTEQLNVLTALLKGM